jgi:hypothetical protein
MKKLFPVFMVLVTALVLSAGTAAQGGKAFGRDDRDDDDDRSRRFEIVEATIPQLHEALEDHVVTSRQLVQIYLKRIKAYERTLNAFIALNPHAEDDARRLDHERARGRVRGPLHGIPIVLKDNILTPRHPNHGRRARVQGIRPAV